MPSAAGAGAGANERFGELSATFPSINLPFALAGQELVQRWESFPIIDRDLSTQYFGEHLRKYDVDSSKDDVFNFPDFYTNDYRAVASVPVACSCVAVVFATGEWHTKYAGLATFDPAGRMIDQLFVSGLEGGTGATYSRDVAIARDGTISVTTTVDVGPGSPPNKRMAYTVSRDGQIVRSTKRK